MNWNHNKILVLEDGNGELTHGQTSYANVVVQYFHDLLGPSCSLNYIDISVVECKVVTEDHARLFVAPVTDLIIFDTIKKMKKNKTPGPNGVNVEFFLTTWSQA